MAKGPVPRRELDHAAEKRDHACPKRKRERSFAFSASTSRSRDGAWVCSEVKSRRAASDTSTTARLKASSLACDGLLKPESFRTNCSAEARISSSVAGGSKLNSVLMLRHMNFLPWLRPFPRTNGGCDIRQLDFILEFVLDFILGVNGMLVTLRLRYEV